MALLLSVWWRFRWDYTQWGSYLLVYQYAVKRGPIVEVTPIAARYAHHFAGEHAPKARYVAGLAPVALTAHSLNRKSCGLSGS